jgi:cytochrome c biogenesis protein CcmG/thiol:disulfide interchange protein DsbE
MTPVTQTDQQPIDPSGDPVEQSPAGQQRDLRARLSGSRLGTLTVLAVTTALVMLAAYVVDRPSDSEAGVRPVTLTGPSRGAAPKIGTQAQDFTATTVDGTAVSLSDYRGQPVWLTFGASWCAACQAEAPDIQSTYLKFKPRGVVVLSVSISEDSAAVRDYSDRIGLTFPMVADPDTRVASAYRVLGIPAHFFIDRAGVLRAMKTGSLSPDKMTNALKAIS